MAEFRPAEDRPGEVRPERWDTRKRERVRCSSLVDWPVYPGFTHTMRASNASRNAGPTQPLLMAER